MDTLIKNKKVSIVMCTYNGEEFIMQQIETIVNQTYPIYELIIQDDCSTDKTVAIINDYVSKYSFIHLYQNAKQKGINKNFFSAIELATGEFIAISDQDDIWELNKIELQISAIGDKLLCSGFSRPFSYNGTITCFDNRIPNYNLLRMMYVGVLPGHTQLFRKELLNLIPTIPEFFTYDLLIQATAAVFNSVKFVDTVLVNQRRHFGAATYTEPLNTSHSISNILKNSLYTLSIYKQLKPNLRIIFSNWLLFLNKLSPSNKIVQQGIKMAKLQSSHSMLSLIRLSFFCVNHRNQLFHVKEKNLIISLLRSLYFPISCCIYYRYLLNKKET